MNAPRAPAQRFLKSSRPVNKTGAIPLVLVSSVLYSFVWWRKQGHKLKGRSLPFSWLQRALEKLTPPAKQPPLKKQPISSWKQQQPAALAAVAAEKRLQVSTAGQALTPSSACNWSRQLVVTTACSFPNKGQFCIHTDPAFLGVEACARRGCVQRCVTYEPVFADKPLHACTHPPCRNSRGRHRARGRSTLPRGPRPASRKRRRRRARSEVGGAAGRTL